MDTVIGYCCVWFVEVVMLVWCKNDLQLPTFLCSMTPLLPAVSMSITRVVRISVLWLFFLQNKVKLWTKVPECSVTYFCLSSVLFFLCSREHTDSDKMITKGQMLSCKNLWFFTTTSRLLVCCRQTLLRDIVLNCYDKMQPRVSVHTLKFPLALGPNGALWRLYAATVAICSVLSSTCNVSTLKCAWNSTSNLYIF